MCIVPHALDGPQSDHVRLGHVKCHLLIKQVLVPLARDVQQNLALALVRLAELLHDLLVEGECSSVLLLDGDSALGGGDIIGGCWFGDFLGRGTM